MAAAYPQWEYDLLGALGAPSSQSNLEALNLWALSEGNVTNNPLATSGKGAGAATCVAQCGSTSPVYVYDTEADGVAQMAAFLQGSYYTAIVRALKQDAGLAAIYQAVNSSKWCQGCQNGQYPVKLAEAAGGAKATTDPTVGTGAGPGGSAAAAQGGSGPTPGAGLSTCVIQLPGFLFFSGPCFLTKGGVKWLGGVAALVAGVGLAGFGVVLLASAVGQSTGATAAAKKAASTVGIGASLFSGQPEVAAGIAAKSKSSAPKAPPVPKIKAPAAPSTPDVPTAGRIESRRIERNYQSSVRQQGPIGPRGGNPTANRVAQRERRGVSSPGPRRREPPNVRGGSPF